MTYTYLTLESVSYVLPTGRTLFTDLNAQFDQRLTGLVGRNGIGKSILAHILAGLLQPSSGRCTRAGSVHYLSQEIGQGGGITVAALTGQQHILAAPQRIEAGSVLASDFDTVGECWDIRAQLKQAFVQHGLAHLELDMPTSKISGGEAMRVALIGAELSGADYLILDEPSNHLDRPNRKRLIEQLIAWPRGMLVVSHDRELLRSVERVVDLSAQGLSSYGGNYDFYIQSKAQQQHSAIERLEHLKHERKQEEQSVRKQLERQERRNARGCRQGKESNQAKILLGQKKGQSERSSGRLQQQQVVQKQQRDQEINAARQQVGEEAPVIVHGVSLSQQAVSRQVARVEGRLPYVAGESASIDLTLTGRQRVGVIGRNGCGKTTLLSVLAGRLELASGHCDVKVESAYLDQHLATLKADVSVLEQLRSVNHTATEGELRMRLAQLGLDAQKVSVPCRLLSGGERLKAALACAFYSDSPAQLLLLDEPSNHLDLPSLQALEEMLRAYQGTLLVISHDDVFLSRLNLTHRLFVGGGGWHMACW